MKALGEYLTSEEDGLRTKGIYRFNLNVHNVYHGNSGVEFLSLVLGHCPAEKLNPQSGKQLTVVAKILADIVGVPVRVFTSFYCEKLNDTETVIPALRGLVTLTALPSFSSFEATNIVQA